MSNCWGLMLLCDRLVSQINWQKTNALPQLQKSLIVPFRFIFA
ncbi:MAG TPA: hypothetical protein V6C90_20825 [Coleofasciculaceae cyanobacterium]